MRLAAEDLNRGRPSAAFNLRIDDSKGKPTDAVTAYRASPPSGNARAVLSWMSSVGNALAPVALRDSVALFVGAALPSLSSPTGLVVRAWPRAQHIGERMGEYASSQNLQRVAILYIDDEYGRSVADAFASVVQRGGISVVAREPLAVGATDFRVSLERVKRMNPRGIYMPAYGAVYVSGLKQIREILGDSVVVMADLPLLSAFTLPQFGDELENVVVTATALDVRPYQTAAAREFAERYRARFGRDADFNSGLGYMMFSIAAQATAASDGSGHGVAAYISRTGTFDGPLGPIRYDARNDCDVPMQIAQFRGGRLQPLTPLRRADGEGVPGATNPPR
jgi:branched-chain amino acid transport system substrate-binding protein